MRPVPRHTSFATLACLTTAFATPALAQEKPVEHDPARGLRQIDLNPANTAARRPILPEGSFIAGQEGTLVRTPSGDRIFVYLPDEGHEPTALLVAPCLELERLEEAAEESDIDAPIFLMTGQILAYHRRNYLLPSAWTQLRPRQEVDGGDANTDPVNTSGADSSPPAADDEIAALIEELEQSRDDPQSSLHRGDRLWLAPKQAAESIEDEPGGLADGSMISRLTGRFIRQGVVWIISFDNDADSTAEKDTPLIVLPCLNHEKLERLAGRRSDEFTVEISGRVFLYRGRYYLMPTVFQAVPRGDVDPIG